MAGQLLNWHYIQTMEFQPTPIQEIASPLLIEKEIRLLVKRDDLNHPIISGNKLRKLKYNLAEAKAQGHHTLLTFGGAFSNHIYAVAGAGSAFGFKTIGIIRGEEHLPLNPTLTFAKANGMQLHYMDRQTYRDKTKNKVQSELQKQFGEYYLLPEGGTNDLAIKGCEEVIHEINIHFDVLCCPVGTGGTIAGLIAGLKGDKKVIGFSSLKGDFLQSEVSELLRDYGHGSLNNWQMQNDYNFGGYAKVKPALTDFINGFEKSYEIPLEPIYTAKMFYGIFDLIEKDYFERSTNILALHTGGLQGNAGFDFRN